MKACGHFPVFFSRETALDDFSVDKQAQAKVTADMEAHVRNGGGLSMFPEGVINRGNTKGLQSFRRGALALARERGMSLWGFLHTGIDQVWSVHEAMGGNPGKIRFKLFNLTFQAF